MTLDSAVKQFAQALREGFSFGQTLQVERPKSERTVEAYQGSVYRILSTAPVDWDDPAMANFLVNWRRDQSVQQLQGAISLSKIRLDLAGLRKFYHWAKTYGLVSLNPTESLPGVPDKRRLPRPIPAADIAKLRDTCRIGPTSPLATYRIRAMLECFMNGLRRIEVVRMNVDNVVYDPVDRVVTVRVQRKGGMLREIPLNAGVASFLVSYLLEQYVPQWRTYLVPQADDALHQLFQVYRRWHDQQGSMHQGVPVFIHRGQRVSPSMVNYLFTQLKHRAGITRPWGPHSLRHAFATQLLNRGVDIRTVQELLGHAHITQTQLYTEIANPTAAGAVQLLDSEGVV